ncbi:MULTISPECIES: ATP-dependent DNA helicase [Variovorax]|uniref:ATP-dependent DNA helicase n=1 Tax=Variovorax TaxID=34072 RepID=UPI00086F69E2|nr:MULTISPECIES: ATP-dependent DNA helicase [Variovorax]MBN8753129.1 ATP-dependent DNA helicase [Variovorax sp.]ODU11591.1 MAG: helicase [Variovorax sp. SCN 67-85]ODV15044.1 MAG: helicase [Variovorax sp. SCN 67-20]OJZ05236.1 MAG: helicase [Variovorax sp. 67-131]UKI05331.1 ATP-dependent DNA helicase [Variovorax paradoxus]
MTGALEDKVRDAFAQDGALSRAAEQFRERSGQTEMAMAVARTIDQGGVLVVEAGTGVGKTFSYLVPALLSGERVLLSTATKTLQDQLFGRDLPRLVEAFGLPVRTALLKGRGSYLCLHRLDTARHDASLPERGSLRTLAKIEQWSKATRTGDLAELPGLDERSPLIPLITSTRENCLGAQCPQFKACHVNLARREALAADIVVINHHLFFADLAVRETGMAELLPTVSVVVFDEAHQLNETGVQFLGAQLGSGQALDFARDMLGSGLQHARGLVDWQQLVSGVERTARELRLVVGKQWPGAKLRWLGPAPEGIDPDAWQSALDDLQHSFEQAAEGLATVSEISPDFVRLHERARQLAKRTARFALPCEVDSVRWVDVGSQLRLIESPLDIADAMRKRVLKIVDEAGADADDDGDDSDDELDAYGERSAREAPVQEDGGRAWVFTSATLGDEPTLRWFTEPCGLHDAEVLRVQSPFDYASQAALYVPRAFPKPNDPSHSQRVAQLAARGAAELGGRTLVLTTTLRALRTIGDAIKQQFELLETEARPEVLVQGELPKRVLMDRFREGASAGRAGCVLVASASFWEGFDAPGDALQLVVIDKLPFPPPNDPLVEARSQRLEAQGRSSFADYSLPEAAVALKQGAGRLIRRETDSGVLAICDTRLVAMGYGRRLLAALPPMRRLENEADFDAALDALKN